jgi:hypothetical protein
MLTHRKTENLEIWVTQTLILQDAWTLKSPHQDIYLHLQEEPFHGKLQTVTLLHL